MSGSCHLDRALNVEIGVECQISVMPLAGVQLTLFQPGGADYAHLITASPPGFENLTASLLMYLPTVSTIAAALVLLML